MMEMTVVCMHWRKEWNWNILWNIHQFDWVAELDMRKVEPEEMVDLIEIVLQRVSSQ